MSDSTIDFVRPYAAVAQRHKDGLDAIITSIGTGGPGTVTIDDLMDAVYDYLVSVYTDIGSDPEGGESVRALIANAINGYLDNGGSSPYLRLLQAAPPTTLANQFDRLFDASKASSMLKSNAARHQMTLEIGEANMEYWMNQISTSGDWENYMTGEGGIDIAAMPFWTDAAMFGTQFDFYQNNATDSTAVSSVIISALAGSLVVGAGKLVFGWVPKIKHWGDPHENLNGCRGQRPTISRPRPVLPGLVPLGKVYGYSCYHNGEYIGGSTIEASSGEEAQNALDYETGLDTGYRCYVDVA